MKESDQTVLIIEPVSSSNYILSQLKQNDLKCIAVVIEKPLKMDCDRIAEPISSLTKFDDIIRITEDPETTVNQVKEMLTNENVVCVISGTDEVISYTESLSEYFCPEFTNPKSTIGIRSSKRELNQFLLKRGIAVPEQWVVSDTDRKSIKKISKSLNYPVFMKPNEGHTVSFLSQQINSETELIAHCINSIGKTNKYTKQIVKSMLIEELLQGVEFVIDTFSDNHIHIVTGIFRYQKKIIDNIPVYESATSVSLDDSDALLITQYVIQILNECQIKFGANHTEVMLTKQGPKLIEINPRISGAYGAFQIMSLWSYGFSQVSLLVQFICKNRIEKTPHFFRYAATAFLDSSIENTQLKLPNLSSQQVSILHTHDGPADNESQIFTTSAIVYIGSNSNTNIDNDLNVLFRMKEKGTLFIPRLEIQQIKKDSVIIYIATLQSQVNMVCHDCLFEKANLTSHCHLIATDELKNTIPRSFLSLFESITWMSSNNKGSIFTYLDLNHLRETLTSLSLGVEKEKIFIFFSGEGNIVTVSEAAKDITNNVQCFEKAIYFKNKDRMKDYLNKFDICTPKHISDLLCIEYDPITSVLKSPFVIKPNESAGAEGFQLINNENEFKSFKDNTHDINNYSAESFINGTLYHIDSVVHNNHIVRQVLSEYGHPLGESLKGMPAFSIPRPCPNHYEKKIIDENVKVIQAFNVNGVFHTEYFLTPAGEVFFLETAWRCPGKPVDENFTQLTGINQMNCYIGLKANLINHHELLNLQPYFFNVMLMRRKGIYEGFNFPLDPSSFTVISEISHGSVCEQASIYLSPAATVKVQATTYEELYHYFEIIRKSGTMTVFKKEREK